MNEWMNEETSFSIIIYKYKQKINRGLAVKIWVGIPKKHHRALFLIVIFTNILGA